MQRLARVTQRNNLLQTRPIGRQLLSNARNYSKLYLWGSLCQVKKTMAGSDDARLYPNVIEHDIKDDIVSLGCGSTHMAVVTSSGDLYTSGLNALGQCAQEAKHELVETFSKVTRFANDDEYWDLKLEKFNDGQHDHDAEKVKFSSVTCGKDYTVAVCKTDIYATGSNDAGQLGVGYSKNRFKLHRVPLYVESEKSEASKQIKQVACGAQHTIVLFEDGEIFAFGSNSFSQLANSNPINLVKPRRIEPFTETGEIVVEVSCGLAHTVFRTNLDRIYAVGRGYEGQLGLDAKQMVRPVLVDSVNSRGKVKHVSCGNVHSVAVVHEGNQVNAYIWGHGITEGPVAWGGGHATISTYQKRSDEHLPKLCLTMGEDCLFNMKVSSGAYHSLIHSASNELFTAGYGTDGQLGNGMRSVRLTFENISQKFKQDVNLIREIGGGFAYSAAVI